MGIFCLSRVLFVFTVLKKGFKSVLNVSDSAAYLDLFHVKLKVILPDIFRRTLTFPLHVVSSLKVRSKDQWKPSEGWVLPGSAQRRLSGGDRCVNWLTERNTDLFSNWSDDGERSSCGKNGVLPVSVGRQQRSAVKLVLSLFSLICMFKSPFLYIQERKS